ncbi:MAG: hypothetical protein ACETWM_09760 [Candidatus Lokiarchaeia archaeon]
MPRRMVACLLALLVVLVFVVALVSAPTLAVASNTMLANQYFALNSEYDYLMFFQNFIIWWTNNNYCVSIGGSQLLGQNIGGFTFPIYFGGLDYPLLHISSGGLSLGGVNLGGGLSFTLPGVTPTIGAILLVLIFIGCVGTPATAFVIYIQED